MTNYTSRKNHSNKTVFTIVTERVIKEMEKGIVPWRKPWDKTGNNNSILAKNAINGNTYSFINQILLGMRGGQYVGKQQMEKYGGTAKPDAPKYFVTGWFKDIKERTDKNTGEVIVDENGNPKTYTTLNYRYYWVWDVNDVEGLKLPKHRTEERHNTGIDEAENVIGMYIKNSGIGFNNEGSDMAFYRPSTDSVTVPNINQFKDVAEYYSTTFHELTHSTGHPKRLDRLTSAGFGTSEYAKEELVAELGSAFALATLEIDSSATLQNSTAYLQGWIKALKNDDHLIYDAAKMAEEAVNLIFKDAEETETTEEPEKIEETEEKVKEVIPTKPKAVKNVTKKTTRKTPRKPSAQSKVSNGEKKVRKTKKDAEKKQEKVKEQIPEQVQKPSLDINEVKPKIEERYGVKMEADEDGHITYKTKKGKVSVKIGTYNFKEKEGVQFYDVTMSKKNAGAGSPCDTEEEMFKELDKFMEEIKTNGRRK